MTRFFRKLCPALAILLVAGCNRTPNRTEGQTIEHYIPNSGSVGFDIAPIQGDNESSQWNASYTSQGKTAQFRIEFGPAKASDAKDSGDFPFRVGKGRIVAVPGSDPSVLLADLQKALEAKHQPTKIEKIQSLPFTFVNIGTNMSQAAGGGFFAKPLGHWTTTKIFIGEGENEGEFFLNINPAINKGQFSIKDADYGDIVVSQLARVL